jgi:hypothetical protein
MINGPGESLPSALSPRSRLWLGVSLFVAALQGFHAICYPIARDQATYLYIGQRLWDGKQLYRDVWDIKPPEIFYLYAVIVKIFGDVMWSVGLVDIIWLLIVSCFIFKFAERQLGTSPAVVAVVLHAAARRWLGYWDAAQPENFLILFVFAAYFLSSYKGRLSWVCDLLSGMFFAAAFWVKYNAVAFVPMVLVLPYLDFTPLARDAGLPRFTLSGREWIKRSGFWAAGFAGVAMVVVGYLAWVGAWPAMHESQFVILPRHNAMVIENSRSYWLLVYRNIGVAFGWWSLLVAAVAILVARRTRDFSATLPVFLATAIGVLCTAMQARLPTYAFETCYPFFAMLGGYLAVKIFQAFRRISRQCWGRGWRLAAILVWIVFANLAYLPLPDAAMQCKLDLNDLEAWWHNRDTFYRNYPWARRISQFDGQMHVIEYLRQNSGPQDGVYIWGTQALIYFRAHRNPPTRFVVNLDLTSLWTPPSWRRELVRSLEAAPPKYIVVVRNDGERIVPFNFPDSDVYLRQRYPALLEFVTSYYQKVDDYQDFAIYRHD